MQMAIGLTFPATLKDESIICYLCKNFDINLNIIEASFSTYSGWAILKIEGDNNELERAFEYIRSKGINIEKIETMK